MREDIKDIIKSINELVNYAEDCVSAMQVSFIYNNPSLLKGCEVDTEAIKKIEPELIRLSEEIDDADFKLKLYASICVHLLKMWEKIDMLSKLIERKIREKILFPDKSVNETIFLLQRLVEILKPTADIILARNTFLRSYIQESQISLEKMAAEYSTFYEDRLIKDESQPVVAPLHLKMLDAINSIAWHTKEIAIKLTG
jgi:Na+/phosphate symporter